MTDNAANAAFGRINFDIVQRSRNGNAVKTAAYIMCACLGHDGTTYDFTRKRREYADGCIMLPNGAPADYADAQTLWAAAEAAERRVDAQVARQLLFSIPRQCPPHLRLDLLRAVCQPYVDDGAALQIAIHTPPASDGAEQPHAHVQMTMRRVGGGGFAAKKETRWNVQFRENNGRAERQRIADRANDFFLSHSLDVRIDPRSLADRGIDRAPEPIAPQRDWQLWLREGAKPDAKPIRVEAVFEHRTARQTWAKAAAAADAWGEHAKKMERELEALRQKNAARAAAMRERSARPPASPVVPKIMGPETKTEETQMARRPNRKSTARNDSWMRGQGGWAGLTDEQQKLAQAAHERWTARGGRQSLDTYVQYVQDARRREEQAVAEAAQEEREDTTPTVTPAATQQPDGIAPVSSFAAERSRHNHLERLLAERYQVPAALAPHVRRVELNSGGRTATLHTSAGRITDHGDRLTTDGRTTPELAAATIAAAAAKGWQNLKLTGRADYKRAVAIAAALHQPPLTTDFDLDSQGRATVAVQLRERAVAAVPALLETTGMTPADAARTRIDHERARAQAALAGEPTGERDPRRIAAPLITEAIARRDQAKMNAAEASAAAAAHREQHGWTARLLGPAARRQAALDAEAATLDKGARRLDRGHDRSVRRIERDAARQAWAHEQEHKDWSWSRPIRQAQSTLARLDTVAAALTAGDEATVQAAATTGSLGAALAAAEGYQQRQAQAAVERERARLAARSPAELKKDALAASLAAEQDARRDPRKMEIARRMTAAIATGDPSVTAAAANGDMQAAALAAAECQRREKKRQDEIQAELAMQAMLRERTSGGLGIRFE